MAIKHPKIVPRKTILAAHGTLSKANTAQRLGGGYPGTKRRRLICWRAAVLLGEIRWFRILKPWKKNSIESRCFWSPIDFLKMWMLPFLCEIVFPITTQNKPNSLLTSEVLIGITLNRKAWMVEGFKHWVSKDRSGPLRLSLNPKGWQLLGRCCQTEEGIMARFHRAHLHTRAATFPSGTRGFLAASA